jgi:small conductance mechanosensitive channel
VGRVLIVAVAVLLSVNVFVDIGPLLAGAGILGLAFSFGAQSLVKDVISGFFILVEDQFRVGDVIEAGGKSGLVERMSLRLVMLRDSGGALHMIPNGSIATVSNFTRGWSRAVVDVGVAYEDDIDRAIAVVRSEAAALAADPAWRPRLDGEPDVLGVEQLADSAVVIRTLLRTKAGQHWPVAREFRRRLKVRFDREHIEIPYQKRKVQVTISGGADPNEVAAQAAGGAA